MQLSANHDILQIVDCCTEHEKESKLGRLLDEMATEPNNKVLVFTETKRKCDELTRTMRRHGYVAQCIHGDKQQQERDWVLKEFRSGKTQILVATDVAARGLGEFLTCLASCHGSLDLAVCLQLGIVPTEVCNNCNVNLFLRIYTITT